jgi:hypothetical protein
MSSRLPNLLITGVTKAGTTSLFFYLAQHPQICGASLKETEYFSRLVYPNATLDKIETYERYFRHCRDEQYVLEASPNYWYGGQRLFETTESMLDHPRYVVSLRNPVDRFWSDFTAMKSKMLLDAEMSVQAFFDQCLELRESGGDFTEAGRRFRTFSTGFYVDYLHEWLPSVADRGRIVFFEHLTAEPVDVVRGILEWLGLESGGVEQFNYSQRNETIRHRSAALQRMAYAGGNRVSDHLRRHPRTKERLTTIYYRMNSAGGRDESLDPEVARRLHDLYREPNRQLREVLLAHGYQHFPAWLAEA